VTLSLRKSLHHVVSTSLNCFHIHGKNLKFEGPARELQTVVMEVTAHPALVVHSDVKV